MVRKCSKTVILVGKLAPNWKQVYIQINFICPSVYLVQMHTLPNKFTSIQKLSTVKWFSSVKHTTRTNKIWTADISIYRPKIMEQAHINHEEPRRYYSIQKRLKDIPFYKPWFCEESSIHELTPKRSAAVPCYFYSQMRRFYINFTIN